MIISFSQLGKHGRLGNQLFQVSSTLGMAERYGAEAAFPAWEYEEYFEVRNAMGLSHGDTQLRRVEEKQFGFYDWQLRESCDLLGYLQSEKYFGGRQFRFKAEFLEAVKAGANTLFSKPVICIQIRRGDYVGNPNYFQIPAQWYIHALVTHFPNWRECNILFISDDIEYCRVHFECLPNAFFVDDFGLEGGAHRDVFEMALASMCDHFIISNSSFGWWCGWLGERRAFDMGREARVVHCGELHAGKLAGNSHADYYPERWIEHKPDSIKFDLRDVTFMIPVFFDHADRRGNMDLSLFLLQSAFDTNFIVCEQGGKRFSYTATWAKYLLFDGTKFHRTKMLNTMSNAAETPYIVNWDCDVILPPMQLWMAVEELRNGADMVFPYDGRFARMQRAHWMPKIQRARDIGIVGNTAFPGRERDHNSVGGAVLFNREAFMDGGMENENFISFGPEDCERHDRFKILGYDIRRVGGSLFHMNHYVGMNSSKANPHFKGNHAELEKIRAMNREQLRAYVDTWSWRHPYTSRYYHTISEGAIRSAQIVLEILETWGVEPKAKILDVGCGVGEWSCGNPNYFGIDFRVRRKDLLFAEDHFIECDLEKNFPPIMKVDLALCLEVAEHLSQERAEALVEYLCACSNRVLFSAAIPYQGGVGHVNERWQDWWAELFAAHGFGAAKKQPDIRNNTLVEYWYRNNIVLYERGGKGKVLPFILPGYYMEIVGHWKNMVAGREM